jgi:hypothetical protein
MTKRFFEMRFLTRENGFSKKVVACFYCDLGKGETRPEGIIVWHCEKTGKTIDDPFKIDKDCPLPRVDPERPLSSTVNKIIEYLEGEDEKRERKTLSKLDQDKGTFD